MNSFGKIIILAILAFAQAMPDGESVIVVENIFINREVCNFGEKSDNCIVITPEDICKRDCNVKPWPHADCDKYFQCNGEVPVLTTCSEGLHFNPTTYTCDMICNAGCVRGHLQSTSDEEGIRVFIPWSSATPQIMEIVKSVQ